jgi:hypothetical protein
MATTEPVLSSEEDRRAAVIVIHGSDEKIALESFAEWIRSGRRIGYEKISRVSDAIAKARRDGRDAGLMEVAELLEADAAQHQEALRSWTEPPAHGSEDFVQFYADEFARQCSSSNAKAIRSLIERS